MYFTVMVFVLKSSSPEFTCNCTDVAVVSSLPCDRRLCLQT